MHADRGGRRESPAPRRPVRDGRRGGPAGADAGVGAAGEPRAADVQPAWSGPWWPSPLSRRRPAGQAGGRRRPAAAGRGERLAGSGPARASAGCQVCWSPERLASCGRCDPEPGRRRATPTARWRPHDARASSTATDRRAPRRQPVTAGRRRAAPRARRLREPTPVVGSRGWRSGRGAARGRRSSRPNASGCRRSRSWARPGRRSRRCGAVAGRLVADRTGWRRSRPAPPGHAGRRHRRQPRPGAGLRGADCSAWRCRIFVPAEVADGRVSTDRPRGPRSCASPAATTTPSSESAREAARIGRCLVSDTSWPGYERSRKRRSDGYATILRGGRGAARGAAPSGAGPGAGAARRRRPGAAVIRHFAAGSGPGAADRRGRATRGRLCDGVAGGRPLRLPSPARRLR